MRKLVLAATVLFSALLHAETQDTTTNTLQLEDVFALEYASSPAITKIGDRVYFVRNFMDINSDRQYGNIWSVEVRSKALKPVTTGFFNDRTLRLSPDGNRLAFVSDRTGRSQIHIVWLDDYRSTSISNLPSPPSSLSWSPDGKSIAFSMFVEEQVPPPVSLKIKPKGASWAKPPVFIDDVLYRDDSRGYSKKGNSQVFVISAEGGVARQLTSGPYDHRGKISWARNGEAVFLAANRRDKPEFSPLNSDIYRVSVADGGITQLTDREGPDYYPVVSPDGKQIAFLGHDDNKRLHENTRLYVMSTDGSDVKVITPDLDRDVQAPSWHKDSRTLVYKYDDQGVTKLVKQRLNGGATELARDIGGTYLGRPYASGHYALAEGGDVAFTITQPGFPAELAVVDTKRPGKAEQITQLNGDLLNHRSLARVEEIWVPSSHDKLPIHAWVAYPPGFDKNKEYPLLLEIHGGPVANYGPRFSAEVQLFAAAGYVVVYANPRGSNSYGTEFINTIHHNYPSNDFDDLMSVVDAVIDKGNVDDQRLFVTGGSGGGVLTSWIVSHTHRFKAAVVAKPVINWYSFVLTADRYPYFYQYWFPALPWEDTEGYMKRSPISYVGNVKTPTMLLTGEKDYRTPISETEQYYQALQLAGVDTAMVRIPDASHGITKRPSNLINKVAYILWWLDKYDPTAQQGG